MPATDDRSRKPPLIDKASQKLLEWHAKALAEKRRGKVAIELTYDESGAVLLRELIDLTTK